MDSGGGEKLTVLGSCETVDQLLAPKIKQERIDPEIEQKILAIAVKLEAEEHNRSVSPNPITPDNDEESGQSDDDYDDEDSNECPSLGTTEANKESDDKKLVGPVKSSNEILAELFKVFNAAPPEELLDKNLLNVQVKKEHKHKKHKKDKKKKKHRKQKSDGERSSSDSSDTVMDSSIGKKHKKKKKHKHKEDKDKEKKKDREKKKDKDKNRDKPKERHKSKEKSREKIKDQEDAGNACPKQRTSPSLRIKEEQSLELQPDLNSNQRKRRAEDTLALDAVKSKCSHSSGTDYSREGERGHDSVYNGRSLSHDERGSRSGNKIKTEPLDTIHHHHHHQQTSRTHHKDHHRDGYISEVSLSDEETFLKERERSDGNRRRPSVRDDNRTRVHNSFYAGAERSRSRDGRASEQHRSERQRYYGGSSSSVRRRSRSRSRSHNRDLGIDKKRLLEIARKNAISMFKRGNLPGCAEMSEEVKDKVLLKMRYGGRTVQDLTDFCKKISNGENLSELSSDEDSDADKSGNAKAFHHPFQLKDREPIVMHIRNATPIAPRQVDDQVKAAITSMFPVSSGQQHRKTEAWVPVESKGALVPLPTLPAATQSTTIFKAAVAPVPAVNTNNVPKNVFAKPMPQQEQQEPAFKPVGVPAPAIDFSTGISTTPVINVAVQVTTVPQPVPPVRAPVENGAPVALTPTPFIADVPVPSAAILSESVFPKVGGPPLDVSSIISKRLNAMRRLQDNPMDSEAIKMMYNSQRDMTSWASSKHMPGQFTGSTGVHVLSTRELNSGPQLWARRDQLTSTQPVTGGMGMQLLQKMGWKPGEGLGREKTGSLQPLLLDVKLDKRGLVSKEDSNGFRRQQAVTKTKRSGNNVAQAQQNLEDKHPVCLLNELTSKRKWTPPLYTLVNEVGPSHSKMFLFSVSINGQTFTPLKASNTKKEAKLLTARFCLQQMGILPQ